MENINRESINRGRQIKFVRQYRGITQTGLCKKVKGLPQANLSKLEAGYINVVSDEKIKEIMIFFNWPLEFLDRKYSDFDFTF